MLTGKILHTFAGGGEASRLGGGRSSPTATGSSPAMATAATVEAASGGGCARGGVVIEVRGGVLDAGGGDWARLRFGRWHVAG